MKRGTVTIRTSEGLETYEGWLLSPCFAAYKDYRDWRLSHTPTGYAVFPWGFRRLKDAEKMAAWLEEQADWDFTDPNAAGPEHRGALQAARQLVKYDAVYNRYEWVGEKETN